MAEVSVGIDVSKDWLDVAMRPSGKNWRVGSDDAGLVSLLSQLKEERPHLVVLEATGGYEVPVVPALGTAGILLSDRPLVLRSSRTGSRVGVGWGNSDAMTSMPLCPTSFLVLLYNEAGCISQG